MPTEQTPDGNAGAVRGQRRVSVVISGRVQGVSYRAWTKKTADGLGLSGHVRNRADRAVGAVFRGEAMAVERMLLLCRKGPLLARVDDVAVTEGAVDQAPDGFVIARDSS